MRYAQNKLFCCPSVLRCFAPFCQIKVAVSADRDCVRAYQPQISSTNYNTLMLNVKTQEPDNLLFYLGSSTSVSERPRVCGDPPVSSADIRLMKTQNKTVLFQKVDSP